MAAQPDARGLRALYVVGGRWSFGMTSVVAVAQQVCSALASSWMRVHLWYRPRHKLIINQIAERWYLRAP
jgi:hypothetical protein